VFAFSISKRLAVLILALFFAFSSIIYAQTPAPPLSSIDFAGMRYDLAPQETEESFNFGTWYYRPALQAEQQLLHPELVLYWTSDEWISDDFDEKSCPHLKDEPIFKNRNGSPSWVVIYKACEELYDLQDEEPDIINTHTDQREIAITSITRGGDIKLGEFVQFTISRYIPVPIEHYDNMYSVLRYAYTVRAYGPAEEPSLEQAVASLKAHEHEWEQWVNALLTAPVPQFILDRGRYYKNCAATYGSEKDDNCPW